MSVSVLNEGRRYYLIGGTYAIKDELKDEGFHWDGDRRAWWTTEPERAYRMASVAEAQQRTVNEQTLIWGRIRYKDCEYFLIWRGMTSRGEAAKVCTSDGSRVFWISDPYETIKIYKQAVPLKSLSQDSTKPS